MIIDPSSSNPLVRHAPNPPSQPIPTKTEPVLLVHGTSANRKHEGNPGWWQPQSEFCGRLESLLAAEGSSARIAATPFAWTGANSELARLEAGRALSQRLAALEVDKTIHRYHLIGHSHGGNVILNALRSLETSPRKLGRVIFMGTPVLTFRHRLPIKIRWIAIAVYSVVIYGGLRAYPLWPTNQFLIGTVIASGSLALLAELFFFRSKAHRNSEQAVYGSGYARAFAFECDEAIESLRVAQEIAAEPKRFIDQFIRPGEPAELAIPPTAAPSVSPFGSIEESGLHALMKELEASAPSSAHPQRSVSPQEPINARIPDSVISSLKLLETTTAGVPLKPILTAFLWVLVFLPRVLTAVITGLISFVRMLFSRALSFIAFRGAVLLGRIALPALVRNAAFGADEGRFVEVSELPPGVCALEPLSPEVKADAARVGTTFSAHTGNATIEAITHGDAFSIKDRVTDALTNEALAHGYYYKSAEIQRAIARLIAARPPFDPDVIVRGYMADTLAKIKRLSRNP